MPDMFTVEEKLAAVQKAIEMFRWTRSIAEAPEHRMWMILKAVALDLQSKVPEVQDRAFEALQRQVEAARHNRARMGRLDANQERALAETLLAHWPAITAKLNGEVHEREVGRDGPISTGQTERT